MKESQEQQGVQQIDCDAKKTHRRLIQVRNFVTDFYHQRLLQDKDALYYQTDIRRHSLESLKDFRVGLAGGDLIGAASAKGYSIDDLVQVGLVRKNKNSYSATIPAGMNVYPHIINQDVAYWSIKDRTGKWKHQVRKEFADPDWICLNQNSLDHSPVVIVEGENDLLAIVDRGKHPNTIATIGNFNTRNILAHIEQNSKDKTFYLIFDRDDAGKKYTKKYAKAIKAGGGLVYEVTIPEPHKDIDALLNKSPNPQEVFQQLLDEAHKTQSQTDKQDNGSSPFHFKDFQVLGELENGDISIWSKMNRKIYNISIKDLTLDKLDQVGGREVINNVSRKFEEGKTPFRALKREIIYQASLKQLGHPDYLGQGIHQLKGRKVLIVNGGEAWVWDNNNFADQAFPLIEGQFIEFNQGSQWIDMQKVIMKTKKMTTQSALKIRDYMLDTFAQWLFTGQQDHVLLSGWALAQIIQALWNWRSHIWVSGPASSGKTLLVLLFEKFGGKLARRHEGQGSSEAGVRQDLANNQSLNFIDEFEKSDARDKIIEVLRSAGRGGEIVKGSANHKKTIFKIRHMFLLSSIEVGLKRAAEQSRFLVINTKKDPSRCPLMPPDESLNEIRSDIFAYALWAAFKAKDLVREINQVAGFDRRFIDSLGAPFSMIAVCEDDPQDALNSLVRDYLIDWESSGENRQNDEERLIEEIMTANIKLPIISENNSTGDTRITYDFRTISQLIESAKYDESHHISLQTHGVKSCRDGVFLQPNKVVRLLRDTDWGNLNIRDILLRVPGAAAKTDRVASSQCRGVFLPYTALEDYCRGSVQCNTVTGL